jgi:hypothetical protein
LDINVMTLQLLLKGNYVPAEILELFEDFTLFRVSMSNVQCPMSNNSTFSINTGFAT